MDEEEKKIIKSFELHARSPDKVPFIMVREQLEVLKKINEGIDEVRKEIVQLRADVKQELRNRMDDGK
jgi:hypothetical protein